MMIVLLRIRVIVEMVIIVRFVLFIVWDKNVGLDVSLM